MRLRFHCSLDIDSGSFGSAMVLVELMPKWRPCGVASSMRHSFGMWRGLSSSSPHCAFVEEEKIKIVDKA